MTVGIAGMIPGIVPTGTAVGIVVIGMVAGMVVGMLAGTVPTGTAVGIVLTVTPMPIVDIRAHISIMTVVAEDVMVVQPTAAEVAEDAIPLLLTEATAASQDVTPRTA